MPERRESLIELKKLPSTGLSMESASKNVLASSFDEFPFAHEGWGLRANRKSLFCLGETVPIVQCRRYVGEKLGILRIRQHVGRFAGTPDERLSDGGISP